MIAPTYPVKLAGSGEGAVADRLAVGVADADRPQGDRGDAAGQGDEEAARAEEGEEDREGAEEGRGERGDVALLEGGGARRRGAGRGTSLGLGLVPPAGSRRPPRSRGILVRRRARSRSAVSTSAMPPRPIRPIRAAEGPPLPPLRVTAAACFQIRLLIAGHGGAEPLLAREGQLRGEDSALGDLESLHRHPAGALLALNEELAALGALPHAERVLELIRSVTKGNRKAVTDGLGRPSENTRPTGTRRVRRGGRCCRLSRS